MWHITAEMIELAVETSHEQAVVILAGIEDSANQLLSVEADIVSGNGFSAADHVDPAEVCIRLISSSTSFGGFWKRSSQLMYCITSSVCNEAAMTHPCYYRVPLITFIQSYNLFAFCTHQVW